MNCCQSVNPLSNVSNSVGADKELNRHKIYKELSVSHSAVATFLGCWMLDYTAGACDAKGFDYIYLKGHIGLKLA